MAERQKKPFSVNNFAVKITIGTTTVDAFFSKCSQIKKNRGSSPYSDGQTNIVYQLPGSVSYEDVTLSKAFTEDDDALMSQLLAGNTKANEYITVDIQPVYRDGYFTEAIGGSIQLKYCTVKSISLPEIDTAGDAVAMTEVVLSPGYVTSSGRKQFWKEPASA